MRTLFLTIPVALLLTGIRSAQADTEADALLQKVLANYKAANTLSATVTLRMQEGDSLQAGRNRLELKRPHLARQTGISSQDTAAVSPQNAPQTNQLQAGFALVFDGKYEWDYDKVSNQYSRTLQNSKTLFGPNGDTLRVLDPMAALFFYGDAYTCNPYDVAYILMTKMGTRVEYTSHYLGHKTIDGVDYQAVELITEGHANLNMPQAVTSREVTTIYIGRDNLVHRWISVNRDSKDKNGNPSPFTLEEAVSDIQLNKPLPDSDFTFVPPPGATLK